jgi:hypothetical protein
VAGAYTVVNGIFVRGWAVPDNASVFRAGGIVPSGGRPGSDDGWLEQTRNVSGLLRVLTFRLKAEAPRSQEDTC